MTACARGERSMTGSENAPAFRARPPVAARWRRDADVVVVGSGAAGISAALTASAAGLRVLMVTKDLIGGATPLAQGGLAAAIGPGDSAASHVGDTLTAGAGLCEPDVVASLAAAAPDVACAADGTANAAAVPAITTSTAAIAVARLGRWDGRNDCEESIAYLPLPELNVGTSRCQ